MADNRSRCVSRPCGPDLEASRGEAAMLSGLYPDRLYQLYRTPSNYYWIPDENTPKPRVANVPLIHIATYRKGQDITVSTRQGNTTSNPARNAMVEIVPTANPDAVEIHRDGQSIGTIRRYSANHPWEAWFPSAPGATIVPYEVLKIVTAWIDSRQS